MSCGHPKSAIRPMAHGEGMTCGDCVDGYMRIARIARDRQQSETSQEMEMCCDYSPKAVFWNPYNKVVQCHNCGHVWEPKASLPDGGYVTPVSPIEFEAEADK